MSWLCGAVLLLLAAGGARAQACFDEPTELCELASNTTRVRFLKPILIDFGGPQPFAFDVWDAENDAENRAFHFQIRPSFAEIDVSCHTLAQCARPQQPFLIAFVRLCVCAFVLL